MKITYLLILTMLIFAIPSYAQNEANPLERSYRCGDRVISPGEDCTNCPTDVKCLENEICISGRCRTVEKTNTVLVIGTALGTLILAAIISLFLYYRRRKELGLINAKPEIKEEIKTAETKPEVKEPLSYKEVEQEPKKIKTVGSVLLKNFILDRLSEGETRQSITNRLEKAGWKREKIDLAFSELAQ
ncbi:hypothetical protein HYX19_00370, partial [Candidatus Woesearchaeota archaeon]|nr:hypothetical protein [Candidatus Woesearchaeota archaeon]